MALRRMIIWTRVAIGVVLTINALSTAGAQAPGANREPPPPYRPAAGARDLRAVLFNWTWYMGMLRGVDEHELVVSLEYQGKGTIQVDGQPCTLTKYRVSTSYQTPGQRVQYTCTRPNGQPYSGIEVVSGQYAWNEEDRKSTRLNSSHRCISYAVFCLKKKKQTNKPQYTQIDIYEPHAD